ncbi:hypothetical protein ACFYSF_37325 [Streptomyces canus]|uniref:hypothetical protein n=1 Tax=Streptomyces canus TaxID=58343 RepID=UPI0036C6016C
MSTRARAACAVAAAVDVRAAGSDQGAMLLGVVLLVIPVVVPASAAGRLGAARREQRPAALRPAGATPRQILAMTAVEATGGRCPVT